MGSSVQSYPSSRAALKRALVVLTLAGLTAPALDWHTIPGGRYAETPLPPSGKTGFTSIAPLSSGILFTNFVFELRGLTNQIYLDGSGVACGDVDGDGWCDIFFCGLEGRSRLYRNLSNWTFQGITEAAGVFLPNLDATGAAFADIDGDGDLDLIVNSLGGGTHVFFNDGKGHFTESDKNRGMNAGRGGTSMALADIDGNGTLDLYVANYRTISIRDQPNTRFTMGMVNGQPTVKAVNGRSMEDPELANRFNFTVDPGGGGVLFSENGEADVLYRNDGAGRFTPVSFTDGTFLDENGKPLTKTPFDWGLSVMFRDLNGDGAPDIYVCNDFKTPDRIWLNDGHGRFRAAPRVALRETSLSSMGIDIADVNRDGYDDIFVVDMLSRDHRHRSVQHLDIKTDLLPIGAIEHRPQYPRNTLFLNRGDGTYAEIAQFCGLEASEWSWMPVFLDVDLDGYEDILIPNGFVRDSMNLDANAQIQKLKQQKQFTPLEQLQLRQLFPRLETRKLAFHNLGQLKFEEAGAAWGFDAIAISQGMALADLDNDGDLDIVINNLNGPAFLLRNDTAAPRVAVRLKGQPPNTRGIGAKIKVLGGPVPQSQEMICGGRYQSADDAMRVFAAGSLTNRLAIEVRWRSGLRSYLSDVRPNLIYEIDEAGAVPYSPSPEPPPTPQFQDVSSLLQHRHHEDPFDDFNLQPTLANRLSQLGPGVTWDDLDGDGWDDLIIGSGCGGQLAAFRNDGHGAFQPFAGPPFTQPVTRDQTTLLPWQKPTGEKTLLAGSANYEDGLPSGSSVRCYALTGKTVEELLPAQESSPGPLALADIDGDGYLDLFVGGRVISGKYPQPASSMLFRGSSSGLTLDAENTKVCAHVGLVSSAVFSDLDGDGQPDLVLACEWGPIRVFRNQGGHFRETTEELGLAKYLGWWNGVAAGDFDGDGRLDIIASNWGRNHKYESLRHGQPVWCYYGDLAGNGIVQALYACFNPVMKKTVPTQPFSLVAAAMPFLHERIGTCEAYSRFSMEELYGEELKRAQVLQANWFDSTLFLNRGQRFEARSLPLEAQLAPAFAVCVGDLDGDGNEDVFLSQNFFAVEPETSRYDAGRGLLLKGDGQGEFKAVPGQESGLKIYGEQRGAALCDYDGDGRLDLAVSQNAAETKLYKNVTARPGLRVRLKGPPGNPNAIGTTMRLVFGAKTGPAHEIHAGCGYWSCDSVISVLGTPTPLTQIWVRWPGGKENRNQVPLGAREILVDAAGKVQRLR